MSKYKQISHVIFDMDGVLLDTEPLYTKAFQNLVGRYGKTFTFDLKLKSMGSHRLEVAKMIIKELDLPITPAEFDTLIEEQYQILMNDTEIFPDTENVYKNAISSIAKRFGKVYTADIVAKVIGTVEKESARIAVAEMKLPIPPEEFQHEFRTVSHGFFAKHHVPLMPAQRMLRTKL